MKVLFLALFLLVSSPLLAKYYYYDCNVVSDSNSEKSPFHSLYYIPDQVFDLAGDYEYYSQSNDLHQNLNQDGQLIVFEDYHSNPKVVLVINADGTGFVRTYTNDEYALDNCKEIYEEENL